MDTQPQYGNILKALGGNQGQQGVQQSGALTLQQQADNYTTFQSLMNKGVYLPDLLRHIDDLEAKVSEMKPARQELDLELFAVMESAVKNDPDVKIVRQRMYDEKTRVITDICMQDQKYREAVDGYRRAVNAAYIRQKEQASERTGTPEVRQDPTGSVQNQEGISDGEETR